MELFTPDFGLVFWMFIAFGVLFLALLKWGWPMILKGLEARADMIDKGVVYAREAKEQLDHAREQADAAIAEGRRRQADMLREADKMKTQIIEEARVEAQAAAKKVMDAAKVSIEQERKQAQQQFRDEVSSFALEIAEKVTRERMQDPAASRKLVNSLLDQMEKQS